MQLLIILINNNGFLKSRGIQMDQSANVKQDLLLKDPFKRKALIFQKPSVQCQDFQLSDRVLPGFPYPYINLFTIDS